jgi:polyphosphate kinase
MTDAWMHDTSVIVGGGRPESRFVDRELSWLHFNTRVLELAEDPDLPLLERVKFLGIVTSNLDEFFMVRVAGLKRRIAAGIATRSATGTMPRETHSAVLAATRKLTERQTRCFIDQVLPALRAEGIHILRWRDLTEEQQRPLTDLFNFKVFPVLTPLAVDPSHPFPYISGLSLNLAVVVHNPLTGARIFARVKVPQSLDRFVPVARGSEDFVPLEDIIAAHLGTLFPGMEIEHFNFFRVTRNEDVEVEEDDAENLLTVMERELLRRRFGPPVRLEVEDSIDPSLLETLVEELDVTPAEVFYVPWPLDLRGLSKIGELPREDLLLPAFVPKTAAGLVTAESASAPNVLEAMRKGDVLLHHPYDSFSTSVQLFLQQAAVDPQVLAIKQTLYRTSGDSPIVQALIQAAEWGKQVLALVEIKARFDEEANIEWARQLEQAGVHVVYGVLGLKTHVKLSMVVRDDGDRLRRYVHTGTGNYHPKTARYYEDIGLLTTDEAVGEDVAQLFNQLSGFGLSPNYKKLIVAPQFLREGLIARIQRETEHHLAGRPAKITFKCNSIVDERIIDALYDASRAGVPIDIIVRGICSIRPGVPDMSETIRVRSLLGRFLEHSRVYAFANGGADEVLIGSADLMHRNLDRRVEALVPLEVPAHIRRVKDLLEFAAAETTASWRLESNGTWRRVKRDANGLLLADYQETLVARNQTRN